jgi:hypothetical protein
MKRNLFTRLTLAATLAVLSTAVLAHDDATLDKMNAPHSGQLRMVGIHHFELVIAKDNKEAKSSPVDVYITDHAGTKIPSAGATGTATILTGKNKSIVKLTSVGDNRLTGMGRYAYNPETKVIVAITLADKTTGQARFTPSTASSTAAHDVMHEHKVVHANKEDMK